MSFFIDNWMLIAVAFASGALLVWPAVTRGGGAGTVDTTEAVRLMNREKAVVIDVGNPEEFAEGHIAGARNLPLDRLEAELSELEPADRQELLESVGLTEPALNVVTRAAYKTLGLQSYFTAGEKEVRAWTIPIGATAPQAAGVIHTDFEKGFIRAQIYSVDDLVAMKSEKAIREAGKLRVEGKTYVMQDGDICHFLFN